MDKKLFTDIWVYLAASPLLWLTLTILVYLVGRWIFHRSGGYALLNPMGVGIALLAGLLLLTDTPYSVYFQGAQFIHFLLGPATVALAVPLYLYWGRVRELFLPISIGLFVGSLTGVLSAAGIAWLMGSSSLTLLSLIPKSVTTPVAMGIAEKIGGIPSLAAMIVILTGLVGAVAIPSMLRLMRVEDEAVQGFALGLSAHGLGTARALQIGNLAGAFAGLAIGLNALLTALFAPLVVRFFGLSP